MAAKSTVRYPATPLWRVIAAASLALAASRCAPPPCPGPGAHPALVAQLLFGRSLHGGGEVTDDEWRTFLADTVTPRFPDGLTVLDGAGQWRGPDGRIGSERSKLLVLAAADTPRTRQSLEELRSAYRARFGQDSVGLLTAASCAAF